MAWTHYWVRTVTLPQPAFSAAATDARRVTTQIGLELSGSAPGEPPEFNVERIAFNGAPGCELFDIWRIECPSRGERDVWSYCKTERLPYDLCVQCALIVLKHHLGDAIRIDSDGADADWSHARQVVTITLGYGDSFRLDGLGV